MKHQEVHSNFEADNFDFEWLLSILIQFVSGLKQKAKAIGIGRIKGLKN